MGAPSPRVAADFEGGNVESPRFVAPHRLRFAARADRSPRPLWFCFRAENLPLPFLWCELTNPDRCFGPRAGWGGVRPVFSADGRHWQRVAAAEYVPERGGEAPGEGCFRFRVPVAGGRVWVAYSHPYTPGDLRVFLNALPPAVRILELARTPEGRSLPLLQIGDPATARRALWIVARQHAGEAPASWTVEGIVQGLAGALPPRTLAWIAPVVDLDGVARGRYGKDQAPIDFNRDWREQPARPEIAALLAAMARAETAGWPMALALDLHASHHGDTACFAFGDHRTEGEAGGLPRLMRLLAAAGPPRVGFRESDLRAAPAPEGSARAYLARRFGAPVLTLEMSYHLARTGCYLEPDDYRAAGRALAEAVQHWMR